MSKIFVLEGEVSTIEDYEYQAISVGGQDVQGAVENAQLPVSHFLRNSHYIYGTVREGTYRLTLERIDV